MSLLARPRGGKMKDPGKEVVKDTHLITNSSFIFNQVLPVCFVYYFVKWSLAELNIIIMLKSVVIVQ